MNEILFERVGRLGKVTLNRPQALNALTHGMCVALHAQLKAWAADDGVKAVLIRGAGDRAFCAGGDIRKVAEEGKAGGQYPYDFFRDEYRLNAYIKAYPKPYIALVDGIDMGGGVGLSVHGSHRVIGEKLMFAMPETGIGLFPDVGGTYFLARCPGMTGRYLALTGARIKAADALYLGIGDTLVPTARLNELETALAADPAESTIARFAADPGTPPLAAHRAVIDRCFAGDSVEAILKACETDSSAFAQEAAVAMLGKSPTSMKITLRALIEGARLDFRDCMRMEYRMARGCVAGYDFYEGVRAVVIDKDQKPKWNPATLEAVSHVQVDGYFADLGPNELTFED